MPYDILFGGGAYEHDVVKKGVSVELATLGADGKPLRAAVPMSAPARLDDDDELKAIFPDNRIGQGTLYDPQRFWLGAALTAFGIGFNRDVIRELGVPEPSTWEDLTDHRYAGRLAMTDPRQSGSVATTYDSILNAYGWDKGWRVLRGMSANARFFANTSLKPPLEISNGEAAAGPVLEFYGRYQSQSLLKPGQRAEDSRLGYADPPGMVFIDSDPISILRGGPNPEAALEFVRFTLSEQGQALWQFHARGSAAATDDPASWGPEKFELRRMPVRRSMYENHRERFVDRDLRPFEIVSKAPLKGWRPLIIPMCSAFAIDIHADLREAWDAMGCAAAAHADPSLLAELDSIFYAMPPHPLKDGASVAFTEANFKAIRDDWRDAKRETDLRIAYTAFFRERYREVARRVREAGY
jgi:ABC-type Fe3+ transport system substrate-binding protein